MPPESSGMPAEIEGMDEHLRGHDSLADMVGTHISVWRKMLNDKLVKATSDADVRYFNHELNALADIEVACSVEKEKAKIAQADVNEIGRAAMAPRLDY